MKKQICIVTWYNSINYGTCIQAYALAKFLEELNYNVIFLQNYKFYYSIKNISEWFPIIIEKFLKKKSAEPESDLFSLRRNKINNFTYRTTKIISIFSKQDFKDLILHTEIFVTGSDQIWNPNYLRTPFLLSFVPDNKVKIAYSSSIGVDKIPKNKVRYYKKYLKSFKNIAVRERTAQVELCKLLNRSDIEVVLDPVFLLEKSSWQNLLLSSSQIGVSEDEYIFCYFVGDNQGWISEVKKVSKQLNLKIIVAVSESNIVPDIGKVMPDLGIEEFVSCINNAKFVITDSFHAASLSIIFNKNFAIYKRFSDFDKSSQNSRLTDLLEMFGIEERLIGKDNSLIDILKNEINYFSVNQILDCKKDYSKNYLLGALNWSNE